MSSVKTVVSTGKFVNKIENPIHENKAVNQILAELKQKFPELNFNVKSFSNVEEIKKYAASQSGFSNITIDSQILEEMFLDETVKLKYEKMISDIYKRQNIYKMQLDKSGRTVLAMGAVIDQDGEVSLWSNTEKKEQQDFLKSPMDDARFYNKFSLSEAEKKKRKKITVVYKYSYSRDMAKIAQAHSTQSVNGFIASKNGEISKVKATVTDRDEAQKIIKRIKTVIQKGRMKIVRLKKEQELNLRREQAEKKRKIELSEQLREKIRKKVTSRKAMEHCDTIDINDVFEKPNSDVKFQFNTEGGYINPVTNAIAVQPSSEIMTGLQLPITGGGADIDILA